MSGIGRLDEEKGALRILLYLAYSQGSENRRRMIEDLGSKGVGKTAFYSSLKALKDLNLVEEAKVSRDNKQFVETRLTGKGSKVAVKLDRIQKLLAEE